MHFISSPLLLVSDESVLNNQVAWTRLHYILEWWSSVTLALRARLVKPDIPDQRFPFFISVKVTHKLKYKTVWVKKKHLHRGLPQERGNGATGWLWLGTEYGSQCFLKVVLRSKCDSCMKGNTDVMSAAPVCPLSDLSHHHTTSSYISLFIKTDESWRRAKAMSVGGGCTCCFQRIPFNLSTSHPLLSVSLHICYTVQNTITCSKQRAKNSSVPVVATLTQVSVASHMADCWCIFNKVIDLHRCACDALSKRALMSPFWSSHFQWCQQWRGRPKGGQKVDGSERRRVYGRGLGLHWEKKRSSEFKVRIRTNSQNSDFKLRIMTGISEFWL